MPSRTEGIKYHRATFIQVPAEVHGKATHREQDTRGTNPRFPTHPEAHYLWARC